MAYLHWSGSTWFAFSHTDGADGDNALLVAWHGGGADATVTARELLRAGCVGEPEQLRTFMERRINVEEDAKRAAMKDIEVLAPAVRAFLFDVYKAGTLVMPPDAANKHRDLKRCVDEALTQRREHPVDNRGVSMLLKWSAELQVIRRRYPPPRPSLEIRELIHTRVLRRLRGNDVAPEQDTVERAKIAAESEWPRCN
jgi:hypothetical protein